MLLPDLPRAESFTAAETLAIEYSDRFDRMMQMSPFFRPIKGAQFSKPLCLLRMHNIPTFSLQKLTDTRTSI